MRLLQTMYRCVKMHYNICDDYYDHCRIRILGDNIGRNMNEIEYWESFLNNIFPYPRLLSVPRMYKKKKQIQRICLLNIGIAEKVKKKKANIIVANIRRFYTEIHNLNQKIYLFKRTWC